MTRRNPKDVARAAAGVIQGGCPCALWSAYNCAYTQKVGLCRTPRDVRPGAQRTAAPSGHSGDAATATDTAALLALLDQDPAAGVLAVAELREWRAKSATGDAAPVPYRGEAA